MQGNVTAGMCAGECDCGYVCRGMRLGVCVQGNVTQSHTLTHTLTPSPSPWSLPPGNSRRVQDIETEVEFQHAEPLWLAWEVKLDQVVQTVVDGPVKLVWLIAGQDQHKPGVIRGSRQRYL